MSDETTVQLGHQELQDHNELVEYIRKLLEKIKLLTDLYDQNLTALTEHNESDSAHPDIRILLNEGNEELENELKSFEDDINKKTDDINSNITNQLNDYDLRLRDAVEVNNVQNDRLTALEADVALKIYDKDVSAVGHTGQFDDILNRPNLTISDASGSHTGNAIRISGGNTNISLPSTISADLIGNVTGALTGNAATATNATYANWLRTSSHSDHLFHTEWDGRGYFWTYVTAGDGGYRAVRVARSDSAANADHATNADHAASADKTTGGTVNITGYVSGTGSFDRNGNVTVDVVADIRDTPYTYYVGKTNARDYWGKDENGNQWGSTKDHPFASLSYAINQSNSHIFPGNTINIYVNDSGEYVEGFTAISITSPTIIHGTTSEHPVFRCWWDMTLSATLSLSAVDFAIAKAPTADSYMDGVPFFRVNGSGELHIENGCHMVIDTDNFGKNVWPFIEMGGSSRLTFNCNNGPALYLELRGNGVTHKAPYIRFDSSSAFGASSATGSMAMIKIVSPSGTKHTGSVLSLDRFGEVVLLYTPYPNHKLYFDWDIADDSGTSQVDLGKFARLELFKNPGKGQALPGSSVGNVPDLAEYYQWDYA